MFAEYVGLTQDVASYIDSQRSSPTETKNEILRRLLLTSTAPDRADDMGVFDLGQGVTLPVGERLYLYLSKPDRADRRPDGIAEVKTDGLYLEDAKVEPSKGSVLAPAMHYFQLRNGHVDQDGKPISLSAYRQWHVIRSGSLVPLDELKDPAKRRKRKTKASAVDVNALLAELGIA